MGLVDITKKTLTDMNILSAISSTLFIILLGYFCRRKGLFTEQFGKTLAKVVLTVSLPALSFTSFMQDIEKNSLVEGLNILIWGLIIYIILQCNWVTVKIKRIKRGNFMKRFAAF